MHMTINSFIYLSSQHYSGVAHVGEFVRFTREPDNPYDVNAIRIDTMENLQFGHVKGVMAAVLAPIMDAMGADDEGEDAYGLTSIDATVPTQPNYYNCNLEVEFWGKDLTQVPALEQALTYDSAVGKKTGVRILDRNPEAPLPESSSSSRKKNGNGKEGDGSHGGVVSRTVAVKDWKSQKEVCTLICNDAKSHFDCLFPHMVGSHTIIRPAA